KLPNSMATVGGTALYPVLIGIPDGTGTARTMRYNPNFFMQDTVGHFQGAVDANLAILTNSIKLGDYYLYPLKLGNGMVFSTNASPTSGTNITVHFSQAGIYPSFGVPFADTDHTIALVPEFFYEEFMQTLTAPKLTASLGIVDSPGS